MTGDRLRKRVRRIVERDIAAGAHSTSLLHADILALLDADPDTPTTDVRPDAPSLNKQAPDVRGHPDAPVDDGLVERLADVLREIGGQIAWSYEDVARKVVVARPWQAEVDAARQDALNKAADEIAREAKTHPHTISESAHRVWLAGMDHAARVVVRLRERAARGETRQP